MTKRKKKKKKKEKPLRRPGIEPGSTTWKAAMLTTIPPTLSQELVVENSKISPQQILPW